MQIPEMGGGGRDLKPSILAGMRAPASSHNPAAGCRPAVDHEPAGRVNSSNRRKMIMLALN